MEPLVSVNIPTYNSEKTLHECLQSVVNQTYPKTEIIIIDGYSWDRTVEIAKKYGAKIFFHKVLSEARRIGVEKSDGKYVLFLDSDQVLELDAVRKCVDKCEKEGYDAITLFEKSIVEKNTFTERVIAYDKWLFHSQHDDHPIHGDAIPRFFRAEILKKIEWPKELGVQEHNLIHYEVAKRGARVIFTNVYVYHHEPSSLTQFVRKFYRYGFCYASALKQNRRLVVSHSLLRRSYFSKKALEEPKLFAGLFLLYIIKALATLEGAIAHLLMPRK